MTFDIHVIGLRHEHTQYGTSATLKRKRVASCVTYPNLKRKIKSILAKLARQEYNDIDIVYDSYVVYPWNTTALEMPAYDGIIDIDNIDTTEYNRIRTKTHNFDTFRRW